MALIYCPSFWVDVWRGARPVYDSCVVVCMCTSLWSYALTCVTRCISAPAQEFLGKQLEISVGLFSAVLKRL